MIIQLLISVNYNTKNWYMNKKLTKQIVNDRLTYTAPSSILDPQPEQKAKS